jgi:hypothetical protein
LVFEKNANFFAENCRKSQKIVILTSTPDEFVKKIAQPVAQPILSQKVIHNFFPVWKSTPKTLGYCRNFHYAQSYQSPNWRKIAQSGHPDSG